jgi:hypothetical protein
VLLAMCEAGRQKLEDSKRFDMPGFQPRGDWVREMQRYGVLAAGTPADAINPYTTEQMYWKSLWLRPR